MAYEIDHNQTSVKILVTDKIQMYAGDRGAEVTASLTLSADELKILIYQLIKIWRGLKK